MLQATRAISVRASFGLILQLVLTRGTDWDVAALPEILKDGGYYNLLSGKWHLGFKPDSGPHVRGFHRSLALLPGQTNHWAYHPELDKPNAFFARMPILHTVDGKRKILLALSRDRARIS